ncbi:MAG: YraN family protein [Clostridiales bacterium]|nr:YraN family protein [Clostridiales bacterium]
MQKDSIPNRIGSAKGENRAVRYLASLGYRILSHNYATCSGEIDLVAVDGETLVFAEIKTRSGSSMTPGSM